MVLAYRGPGADHRQHQKQQARHFQPQRVCHPAHAAGGHAAGAVEGAHPPVLTGLAARLVFLRPNANHRVLPVDLRGFKLAELDQAHAFLAPLLGSTLAPTLFAIALLCCGLNSTITATLSGQIVMEGFLNLRIAPWQRRLVTRLIAIVPAVLVTILAGEKATGVIRIEKMQLGGGPGPNRIPMTLKTQMYIGERYELLFVKDDLTVRAYTSAPLKHEFYHLEFPPQALWVF